MNRKITLIVTSLLTVLLSSLHIADDIAKGFEPGGTSNYNGIIIVAVFLYAVLGLIEYRVGLIIILLGSIGGAGVPYIHMTGNGLVGPRVVNSGGVLLWVWTNFALGATALVSVVLAAQELWRSFRPAQRTV